MTYITGQQQGSFSVDCLRFIITSAFSMDSIIRKTGLGIAVQSAIAQQGLSEHESTLMALFQEVFVQKFEEFKKNHSTNFASITVKGNYLIDNEFPIGENDKQQYLRCLAHDVKIGNASLIFEAQDVKRIFTVIEGYSRNDEGKKRSKNPKHNKPKHHSQDGGRKRQH